MGFIAGSASRYQGFVVLCLFTRHLAAPQLIQFESDGAGLMADRLPNYDRYREYHEDR
jgi:hypothetical protein